MVQTWIKKSYGLLSQYLAGTLVLLTGTGITEKYGVNSWNSCGIGQSKKFIKS